MDHHHHILNQQPLPWRTAVTSPPASPDILCPYLWSAGRVTFQISNKKNLTFPMKVFQHLAIALRIKTKSLSTASKACMIWSLYVPPVVCCYVFPFALCIRLYSLWPEPSESPAPTPCPSLLTRCYYFSFLFIVKFKIYFSDNWNTQK